MFDEAGEGFGKVVAGGEVGVHAHADGVWDFGAVFQRGLKFASEPRFVGGFGEECEDGVEVRTRHAIDMGGPFHEFLGEGLGADVSDIDAELSASFDAVLARALSVARRDARAGDRHVPPRA